MTSVTGPELRLRVPRCKPARATSRFFQRVLSLAAQVAYLLGGLHGGSGQPSRRIAAGGDDYLGSLAGKLFGDGPAQTTAGAGDDRNQAVHLFGVL